MTANRLKNKVALITGAARGQGAAEAELYAAEGAKVIVTDVLSEKAEAVVHKITQAGGIAEYQKLDVTSEPAWQALLKHIQTKYKNLDILVNNAGVLHATPLLETSLEDFKRVVAVNQIGCFLGMKHAGLLMKDSGGGVIVNISSVGGIVGVPQAVAYTGTKFAVRGMTKTAAMDLGRFNIRVNSIHPGVIDTPMVRGDENFPDIDLDATCQGQPIPRVGTPLDIARLALFVASDECAFSTGSEFIADGGFLAGDSFE